MYSSGPDMRPPLHVCNSLWNSDLQYACQTDYHGTAYALSYREFTGSR